MTGPIVTWIKNRIVRAGRTRLQTEYGLLSPKLGPGNTDAGGGETIDIIFDCAVRGVPPHPFMSARLLSRIARDFNIVRKKILWLFR